MQNILVLIQAYLFGRLGSRVLGLMLTLSLIWWAGPYVGLDDARLRIYLIAGTLALFFGIWLVRNWLVRRRAARFKTDLDSQAAQDESRQMEIAELQDKMNQAIASLKSSELGSRHRGSAALYALPWFMIIGPAAAGKTTLLRNSGLSFPYSNGKDIDIRGFGGTRNCDWWFSNEAVLLDTAGRYTTEQDDREEWLAFLSMLRKHRRRQPLTGAIVAISLSGLLTADAQETARHVKIIRERIDELMSRLGCIFPIYIVFTKCDLLYGFSAYFADLTDKERDQVWGCWMGHAHDRNINEAFARKMEGLHHRLDEMRLAKLSMVRNQRAKGELFDFPAQFDAARDRLVAFIESLTQENPYQDTPHFCGIYLTSATQEGTPLQKILGSMRQAFGYVDEDQAPELPDSKSFFVKNFFKQVVFPNANDVSRTRRLSMIHRVFKTAGILAALGAVAACFLLLSTNLTMNTLLLKKGVSASDRLAKEAQSKKNGLYRDFQALTGVLAQYHTLRANMQNLPLSLRLGIYEGGRQLPEIRSLLLNAFERAFFNPAVKGLEIRLTNYSRQWKAANLKRQDQIRDPYYQALKCYLMLSRPKRLDPDYVTPVLQEIIQERLAGDLDKRPLGEADRRDLTDLIRIYLANMQVGKNHADYIAPYPPNTRLVAKAQNHLKAMPNAGRLYAQILNKGRLKLPALRLDQLIKGPGQNLLTSSYRIPAMFTCKGWRTYVQPEIKKLVHAASQGDWVTGYLQASPSVGSGSKAACLRGDAVARKLEAGIRARYFGDYVDQWFTLLDKVKISTSQSLDDAAKKMLLLSRNDGPIAALMQAVSRNINITQLGGVAPATDGSLKAPSLVPELDAPFHDLRKLTDPGDKMNTSLPINQYLLALTSAQTEVEQMAAAVDIPRQCFKHAAGILGGNGATASELYKCWLSTDSLLNGIDARTHRVAERLLREPIRDAWQTIIEQTQVYLQDKWNTSVMASYKRKIAGKFPFKETGSDASLNDIADFFRPEDGQIWTFADNQLKPFMYKAGSHWTERTWLGAGLEFNRALLRSLSQAARITAGLFRRGQIQPAIRFSIYPMPSPGVQLTRFETNGQHLVYQNEPQEWKGFRWPGDPERSEAAIGCVPIGNRTQAKLEFSGDWSLLRLLHQADISIKNGLYQLIWHLKTEQGTHVAAQLKLRPDRHSNIFADGLFSQFKLPGKIF